MLELVKVGLILLPLYSGEYFVRISKCFILLHQFVVCIIILNLKETEALK